MTKEDVLPPFVSEFKGKATAPAVVSSPHSGTFYPKRLFALSSLTHERFQMFEDAAVDRLFSFVPSFGIPFLRATYARAWVDLNRHPMDLDPSMYIDDLPPDALSKSTRVLAGFGVIPKLLDPETPVYKNKLRFSVERERLTSVHFPYHACLKELIVRNIRRFGYNLLIDVHSMPELPPDRQIKGATPDFVLGDGNGKTCPPRVLYAVADTLREFGYSVTVNLPYSGAYTTLVYGVPERKSFTLQVEIARHLYWDASTYAKKESFDTVWHHLLQLIRRTATLISDEKNVF